MFWLILAVLIVLLTLVMFLIINSKINTMSDALTTLVEEVAENTSVTQSAITLLQGLKAKLDAAGTDPVKLKELSDSLDASNKALADAVTKNTPAETPPTEEPTT